MKINFDRNEQDSLFKFLVNQERSSVLWKLNQLENELMGLRYEGKAFSFNHIKKAQEIVLFLKEKHCEHTKLDENIIYPFLLKHIPRLSLTLQFLKMENQEFQGVFDTIEKILSKFNVENRLFLRNQNIEQLRDKGIYLICLIKSHIQMEEQTVYKAIFQQLHQVERNSLQREIELFFLNVSQN